MKTLLQWAIFFIVGLTSCNNQIKTKDDNIASKNKSDSILKLNSSDTATFTDTINTDTIKKFIVDDYSVTNEMISAQKVDNYSSHKKISGNIQSLDKAWFSNDTLKQALIFVLYTDGHRLATYHFYTINTPVEIIERIDLHTNEGQLINTKQKLQDFKGFLSQSKKINSSYFTTDKGFKLGDSKQKILSIYGEPDKKTKKNGNEILEWDFVGDILYDSKEDLKGKPLAKDNYGHQAYLFFKDGKLIGQILHNDIP